ncbi:MAG TPA: PHP-associated domain-containing protein, partial [Candidatus Sulfopaludibacter sp.]|nr:PHP-associated domain-containing protein [Candidatus Sulfopaludibacter sp.]
APWDVAIEAGRQGLDAIALSPHNQVVWGQVGRWFSRAWGGPIVLASEEIHGPRFHMIAVAIQRRISWRLAAAQTIAEIHRQGGVAIATHPTASAWPAYQEGDAIGKLDGAEVMQPIAYEGERNARDLREFFARSHAAAIGSSDYHGMGPVGLCRTYVFVREATEQGILEAIRARRTVVLDGGRAYGDAELAKLMPGAPAERSREWVSAVCGVLGMIGAAVAGFRRG